MKVDDLLHDASWLQALTHQLHKTRAVRVGGVLRAYIDDEEPDDLVHIDEDNAEVSEVFSQVFVGWRERHKRYVKTD